MNRNLPGIWLAALGVVALSASLVSCSGQAGREIAPEEAKAMILRFLSNPEAGKIGTWVTDSRALVENEQPSRLKSGDIAVGPWMVDPKKQTVQLAINRAQLDGSFSTEDGTTGADRLRTKRRW